MDVVSIRESRNRKNSSSGSKLATSAVDLKRSCRKNCFLGLLIPKGGKQRSVFCVFLVRCPNWWKGGETGEEANLQRDVRYVCVTSQEETNKHGGRRCASIQCALFNIL